MLYEASSDDILEKLNVVEILKDWCENKNVRKVLGEYKMFEKIKKDAL